MLVVAKTPLIRVEVFGEGMADLAAILKKALPGVSITPEADGESEEFIDIFETEWFNSLRDTARPADSVRIKRENAGMTQADLALKTGISVTNISAIENGKRPIGVITAKKLSSALDVDYRRFL